jgi:hypothetical protein
LVESSNGDDVGGILGAGSAHVYTGPSFQLIATIPCPEPLGPNTAFGVYLGAGDLDGDGYADCFVADWRDRVFVMWVPRSQAT